MKLELDPENIEGTGRTRPSNISFEALRKRLRFPFASCGRACASHETAGVLLWLDLPLDLPTGSGSREGRAVV